MNSFVKKEVSQLKQTMNTWCLFLFRWGCSSSFHSCILVSCSVHQKCSRLVWNYFSLPIDRFIYVIKLDFLAYQNLILAGFSLWSPWKAWHWSRGSRLPPMGRLGRGHHAEAGLILFESILWQLFRNENSSLDECLLQYALHCIGFLERRPENNPSSLSGK